MTPRPVAAKTPALIHLPGIAGEMNIDRRLVRGLVQAGVAPVGTIVDWPGRDRGLPALTNVALHAEKAAAIADMIVALQRTGPRPVVLVAHSAGTGVAVQALEKLPPGVNVTTLVLLGSALSPGYDLSRALAHVSGRAIVLYSPYDQYVLGAGTRAFGTYDRQFTDAAGLVGFRVPATAPAVYSKLLQVPYRPEWTRLGNGGDHIGPTATPFARAVLAPLIAGDAAPTTRNDSAPEG